MDSHSIAKHPERHASGAPHRNRTAQRPLRGSWLALAAILFGGIGLGPLNAAFADTHSQHQGHGAVIEPIPEHCLFCVDGVSPSLPLHASQLTTTPAKARPERALSEPQVRSRRPARLSARSPPVFLL